MQWCCHHQFQFLCREILLFTLWTFRFISPKWIEGKNTVCYGFIDNGPKRSCKMDYRTKSQMAVGS